MSLVKQAEKAPLYLIDAYGLIYRIYFAMIKRPLRNNAGKNISALFGFARTMVSLLNEGAPVATPQPEGADAVCMAVPRRLAVVFESKTPTFRHKMYPAYKATRQKAPEDLHAQVPLVEEFLAALGVPMLRAEGFEADDVIATLARQCQNEGRQCYIFSSDKDLLQLVGNGTYELRPLKNVKAAVSEKDTHTQTEVPSINNSSSLMEQKLSCEVVGPAEVREEWGVAPSDMLDLLSITGDSSDNIPGVKGIGDKGAVKFMARYGSLDAIYEHLAEIEGAAGQKFADGKESAYFAKSLITLECAVPLSVASIDSLSIENVNRIKGAEVLFREGVRQSALALTKAAGSGESDGSAANEALSISIAADVDPALLGEGAYKTVLDFAELEALLEEAKQQGFLALDFETDSLDAWHARPVGVSLALRPKVAVYVPLAPHGVRRKLAVPDTLELVSDAAAVPTVPDASPFLDPVRVRDLLAPFFADPDMTIVAHNAKYDYEVSRGWGIPRWRCHIWDTMVAAWLSAPERGNYSLDSLATFYLSYTPMTYFSIVPKGYTFDFVSLETATRYSAEDADLTLRMKALIEPRLQKAELDSLFLTMEMPLLPILAEMEGAGVKIEKSVLRAYGQELAAELETLQAKTFERVGHEFNLLSTKQLQEVLFTERRLTPGKKTKTGYSTDVAVLEALAKEDEVPAFILRHRTLAKLKSTYIDALCDLTDDGSRIHTSFVQTGTATGRLSSREPNLQNIPVRDEEGRRIREAFLADEGKVLISADYSQIELVVLAHLSSDENLIAAFKAGKDVHARTAALIFGIDERDVRHEQRRVAKVINFGVMYGMSAFRLANELGIHRTEAAEFIEAYFKTYSGIGSLIEDLVKKAEDSGYASTLFGRRRYIPAINSQNRTEKASAERVAVNTPIQGTAADVVKIAMLNLDKRLIAEQSPAMLLLQVHDELILEVPENAAATTAALVKEEMENAVILKAPLRVSVEQGKRWGDFH
jgi:DNA polymerase-1